MKIKTALAAFGLFAGTFTAQAASFIISNVNNGAGDTLYADKDNSLMSGGFVTLGYFPSTTTVANIDTIPELFAALGSFTLLTGMAPGGPSTTLSGAFAGYAEQDTATDIGLVNQSTNTALINRSLYSIVTNASSLGTATGSSQFALVLIGTIAEEASGLTYSSNPVNAPIIGSLDTKVGDFAGNFSTPTDSFTTLKMAAVPEPSTALLGAIGALGLLRRRRN